MRMSRYFLFSIFLLFSVNASASEYVVGIEYQEIIPAQQTSAPDGKVEVVEVFWYGCPHCYRMEPTLNKWLKTKPENVHFVRMPGQFNKDWHVHAGVYYVAEILGMVDKVHEPIFDEIDKYRRKNKDAPLKLSTVDNAAAFFLKYGVSREKFMKIYNSFSVKSKLAHAKGMVQRYGIHSVPTFIVNGKYRVNETMAGSKKELFAVINELVAAETKTEK